MYCPECGAQLQKGAWQCNGCGVDVRRILKEEYWSEIGDGKKVTPATDRFELPEHSPEAYQSWRSGHPYRRKQVLVIAAAAAGFVVMMGVVIMIFTLRSTPDNITDGPDVVSSEAPGSADGTGPTPGAGNNTSPDIPIDSSIPLENVPIDPDEVKSRITAWRKAWEKAADPKNIAAYGAFYADDFESWTGRDKASFLSTRKKEAQERAIILIELSDLQVNAQRGKAIAIFKQNYLSDKFSDSGIKKLTFVKRGSKLLIVGEEFEDQTPVAQVSIAQLKNLILEWRTEWEGFPIEKKLGKMPDYYHPSFKDPHGRGKDQFLSRRLEAAKNRTIYTIDIQNIQASVLGTRAIASFDQMFKSDSYADQSTKILIFKLHGGNPRIIFEDSIDKQKLKSIEVEDFWGP